MSTYTIIYSDELYHYGVKGMKWGVRKQRRLSEKLDRNLLKYKQKDKRLLDTRAKVLARKTEKYDRKIAKAKSAELKRTLQAKKAYKLSDYNEGTRIIKKAQKHYSNVAKDYTNMKISAINDPSIKKTSEYKAAGRKYAIQKMSDASYGRDYTILNYASYYGRGYTPQKDKASWKKPSK